MQRSKAEWILGHLDQVADERRRRLLDPALGTRVQALKAYQQRRFALAHAALLEHPRYAAASRFFLDHLYGPADFSTRDDQFARVVPAMVRLFPEQVIDTVATLATLHALSEQLDSAMATHLSGGDIDRHAYVAAWQATGHFDLRERQIALSLDIGARLDRLTRNPLLRHSLRMMRGPAAAAGLSDLQRFLEAGFDAFRAMKGAETFLQSIGTRERELAAALNTARPPYDLDIFARDLP
jgi:hypothetical protein